VEALIDSVAPVTPMESQTDDDLITVEFRSLTGRKDNYTVPRSSLVDTALYNHANANGYPPTSIRFVHNGSELKLGQQPPLAFNDPIYAGQDPIVIHVVLSLRKPVIYLWAPETLDAKVELELCEDWRFSALYPTASAVNKHGREKVSWDVEVKEGGTIYHKESDTEVAYLYWEA